MHEDEYLWVWVGGAAAIIVLMLGLWWWHAGRLPASASVSYDTAMLGDEALQGPDAPTQPVPIVSLPVAAHKSAHRGASTGTTIAAVLVGLPEASRFAAMVASTGLAGELSGAGPLTVFVPDNESFSLLPPGALSLTAPQLKRLVEYHVLAGKEVDVNAQSAGIEEALSGDMLNFSVLPSDKSARINSAVALKAYKASNGIIYIVDEVLLPPVNQ